MKIKDAVMSVVAIAAIASGLACASDGPRLLIKNIDDTDFNRDVASCLINESERFLNNTKRPILQRSYNREFNHKLAVAYAEMVCAEKDAGRHDDIGSTHGYR